MVYTAWGKDGLANLLIEGAGSPDVRYGSLFAGECPDLIWTIEADSWEAAMARYHELQGWEPYVPMGEDNPPLTSAGK